MRHRLTAAAAVFAVLVLGLVPAAIAEDGREPGATPGASAPAATEEVPAETGVDQDEPPLADVVHNDDVIVKGSLSVGWDSVTNYSFGFDTIVLRENNLRIFFDDTSSTASFPANDWRILINQSDNGGQEFFAIEDASAGNVVFKVRAGAPANSISVDRLGRVGIGTGSPVTEMHVADGDTPALRLEQDGTSGWTPQAWDVAGNETNFFVRDVTNGSRLPFRIRPNAPTSSIDVAGDGEVGFGTGNPQASLHVTRSDGSAVLMVEETSTTASQRQLIKLINNGGAQFSFDNGSVEWRAGSDNSGQFRLDVLDGGGDIEFRLNGDGDLEIAGTMSENSDRGAKHSIEWLDPAAILASVLELPVAEWSYVGQDVRHVGPMAQDFAALFGLGAEATSIATRDLTGVAVLAIQALAAENAGLEARVAELEERLERLEALLEDG